MGQFEDLLEDAVGQLCSKTTRQFHPGEKNGAENAVSMRRRRDSWGSSVISSSLSIGPRPGMLSQGREQQAVSLQRKVGILGAKSLNRDLGDVHTWPHSYYLMRQCDGVGGWVRLKYICEGVDAKCAGTKYAGAKCAGAKSTI